MINLRNRSIEVIHAGQDPSGAYVASPNFSQYGACWLRDGTWIAYSMDCVGQYHSARRFYTWAAHTLLRYEGQLRTLLVKRERRETPLESDYLPTRFTLDGGLVPGHWGDYQLDGYGTWLWGLIAHVEVMNDPAFYWQVRPAVMMVVDYLSAFWPEPNYDCWEEHRHQIHTATLGAIYGGLDAVARYDPALNTATVAAQVRAYALNEGVIDGHFIKYFGAPAVDSSLLWVAVPYGLVSVTDPIFSNTLAHIERDLHRPDGGVYRYRADVYFGGGEWLLLTAWLGWVYVECGRLQPAADLLHWIEAQADHNGAMTEQVTTHPLAPDQFQTWVDKWGPVANPLLWSHAMYLILTTKLGAARTGQ
jgi:GH15 family glucan-1,4-alpha-glucosidase